MVKIACHKRDSSRCMFIYEAEVVPRVGEFIHLPHYGLYKVRDVCYTVSDDRAANENEELLFVTVILEVDTSGKLKCYR